MSKQFYSHDNHKISDRRTIQRKNKATLPVISNKPVPIHIINSKKVYNYSMSHSQQPQPWAIVDLVSRSHPQQSKAQMVYYELNQTHARIEDAQHSNKSLLLLDNYFKRKNRFKAFEMVQLPSQTIQHTGCMVEDEKVDRSAIRMQIKSDIQSLLKKAKRTHSMKKVEGMDDESDEGWSSIRKLNVKPKYRQTHKYLQPMI